MRSYEQLHESSPVAAEALKHLVLDHSRMLSSLALRHR